jgi:2-polyprenyl-3-methyl-5-hydroxy-6-metoxy-1,4-benzoquinol methylase
VDINPREPGVLNGDALEFLKELEPGSCHEIRAYNLLEHIREPFSLLKACYQALAPGGGLILRLDNPAWLPFYVPAIGRLGIGAYALNDYRYTLTKAKHTPHYYLWSPLAIKNLLKEAGFTSFSIKWAWWLLFARYILIARK